MTCVPRFARHGVLAAVLALTAWPVAADELRTVVPGTPMPGPLLDLASPEGDGWVLNTAENGDLTFMREGRQRDSSEIASVQAFGIDAEADDAAFRKAVENEIAIGRGPAPRFETLESAMVMVMIDGVECIRSLDLIRDNAAQVGRGKTRVMLIDVHGTFCRHPAKRSLGLAIIYSVRSPTREEDATTAKALAFFDTLRLHKTLPAAPAE